MLFTSEEGVYFLKNRRPFARPEEHSSRWKQQDAPSSGQTGAWRCQRPVFVTTGLGELTSFAPYCPIPGPLSDFISCPTNVLEKKRDSLWTTARRKGARCTHSSLPPSQLSGRVPPEEQGLVLGSMFLSWGCRFPVISNYVVAVRR